MNIIDLKIHFFSEENMGQNPVGVYICFPDD
jgi:hypothetical protein